MVQVQVYDPKKEKSFDGNPILSDRIQTEYFIDLPEEPLNHDLREQPWLQSIVLFLEKKGVFIYFGEHGTYTQLEITTPRWELNPKDPFLETDMADRPVLRPYSEDGYSELRLSDQNHRTMGFSDMLMAPTLAISGGKLKMTVDTYREGSPFRPLYASGSYDWGMIATGLEEALLQ